MGRTNYQPINKDVMNSQRKGLNNTITVDGVELTDWSVYCLDFSEDHLAGIKEEKFLPIDEITSGPALYRGHLKVTSLSLADTFIDMSVSRHNSCTPVWHSV
ncbi:hypothetical protein EB796_005676 [Bugula neritina]|uniref:Uncharacterized protein n=1 Tax=Bugula neritina TaxID=10212 RepID=A0A7J7KDT4_BUGNE|nr:hypothetical protein EB796_005676 [Bugula neritina]